MNNIYIFDSIELLTEEVVEILKKGLKNKTTELCNVAFSGGSTPKAIFKTIAQKYINDIDWSQYAFFWVDDRCVPTESTESNYGEAKRILFDHIEGEINIFPINGENPPTDEVKRYSQEIKENVSGNDFPKFDIVFLGIGTDGHTASIFPSQIELFNSKNICEIGIHPQSGQKRITITGKVITSAHQIIFIATGSDKVSILEEILLQTGNYDEYPAYQVIKNRPDTLWFLDEFSGSVFE